jgi:hypothetical protein
MPARGRKVNSGIPPDLAQTANFPQGSRQIARPVRLTPLQEVE